MQAFCLFLLSLVTMSVEASNMTGKNKSARNTNYSI